MRQAVTVLKSEKVETPIRMHTRTWREKEASAKSDVDCKATDCMYNKRMSVSCRKDQCRRRECLSLSRDGMRDVQMWMCVIFGRKRCAGHMYTISE